MFLRLLLDTLRQIPGYIVERIDAWAESVALADHRPIDVPVRGRIADWELELLGCTDPDNALMRWCPTCDEAWVCSGWRRIKYVGIRTREAKEDRIR